MQYRKLHHIICNVSADYLYQFIRQTENWPEILEPCLDVQFIEKTADFEHVQITALINGSEKSWESKRHFHPKIYGVNATIVKPMDYVKAMNAIWRVIPMSDEQCCLVLEHEYDMLPECMDKADYISEAVEKNSVGELNNIKDIAEKNAATV